MSFRTNELEVIRCHSYTNVIGCSPVGMLQFSHFRIFREKGEWQIQGANSLVFLASFGLCSSIFSLELRQFVCLNSEFYFETHLLLPLLCNFIPIWYPILIFHKRRICLFISIKHIYNAKGLFSATIRVILQV